MWISLFYMFLTYTLCTMVTKDDLKYDLTQIESGRIRVVISLNEEVELGTVYFEKAKNTFSRKPISMNAWAMVDAKIEGLYVHGGEEITPKDMVAHCQELIRQEGL